MIGCQRQIETAEIKTKEASTDKQDIPLNVIKATDVDPRTNEYKTKLKDIAFDFDQDNKEEEIELYTAAGRLENGDMLWDDGQKWLLAAVDENKFYTLYSGYVQLGEVYFTLSTIGEEKIPNVTMILPNHCGIVIYKCAYNVEEDLFQLKTVYESSVENVYFTSIPSY